MRPTPTKGGRLSRRPTLVPGALCSSSAAPSTGGRAVMPGKTVSRV